jgi:Zn-finger protein
MIMAKCYDCTGFYKDGREDCNTPTCPLYPLMPYRTGGDRWTVTRVPMSQAKKEAMLAGRRAAQLKGKSS